MEKKQFQVGTTYRQATARNARTGSGVASSSGVIVVSSGGGGGDQAPSHSHDNLSDLNALSVTDDGYLNITQRDEQGKLISGKAKAGYADHAADAAESQHAIKADHATKADEAVHAIDADHATQADNADKWDNHHFDDYLNQPVRTSDNVQFDSVQTTEVSSPQFQSGFSGSGFSVQVNPDGSTSAEFDFLRVRKAMEVYKLTIQEVQYRGGIVMEGPAVMLIDRVVSVDTNFNVIDSGVPYAYKCFFDNKGGLLKNLFRAGDQARCQGVDDSGNTRYYWRLVVAQSNNGNEVVGGDFVYLSHAGADVGSQTPMAGDVICCCGSRTDNDRDSYMIRYTTGANTPREEFWADVHDFNPTEVANLQSLRSPTENIFKADSFSFQSRNGMSAPLLAPKVWLPATTAYKNEQYTYDGSTWLCLNNGVTTAPSMDNTDWLRIVSKGETATANDTYQLYIVPTPGATVFRPGQPYNATLRAMLVKNNDADITEEIHQSMWIWERTCELDPGGDEYWNIAHRNIGHVLTLTEADLQGDTTIILTVRDNSNTLLKQTMITI